MGPLKELSQLSSPIITLIEEIIAYLESLMVIEQVEYWGTEEKSVWVEQGTSPGTESCKAAHCVQPLRLQTRMPLKGRK